MLEILNNPRVYLYKKEEKVSKKNIEWSCIRKFDRFPFEIENGSCFLRCMAPSFRFMLDVDQKSKEFVVKDVMTMQHMKTIP